MLRSLLALPLLFGLAAPALAAGPSPDPKSLAIPAEELSKARALVHQLGSEQFLEREEAELALAKMGRAARAALLDAANNDPSPEVRSRCQTLLPKATALEMKARLEVFLADTEGKYDHSLPGWVQFRGLIRSEWSLLGYRVWSDRSLDKTARTVFVDFLSTPANRHMVMATGGLESELATLAAGRRQELYNQKYGRVMGIGGRLMVDASTRREPTLDDIATLLFAESVAPAKTGPRAVTINVLLTSSGFISAIQQSDEKAKVYRAIALAWVESRQDTLEMSAAMTLVNSANLQEGTRFLAKLLGNKNCAAGIRAQAAMALARFEATDQREALTQALADNTVAITMSQNINGQAQMVQIQVCDVALAALILPRRRETRRLRIQVANCRGTCSTQLHQPLLPNGGRSQGGDGEVEEENERQVRQRCDECNGKGRLSGIVFPFLRFRFTFSVAWQEHHR